MQATWMRWVGAAALALSFALAGCPSAPCDNKCTATQTCNRSTNKCEDQNPCGTCPAGEGCDVATASCKNLCTPAAIAACHSPETCKPETGKCVNLCEGVTCSDTSKTCDPTSGSCVSKCTLANCTATQSCDEATGNCVEKCQNDTTQADGTVCDSGWKCQKTTGKCVPPCTDKTCGDGQYCEPASGECKSGPPPAGFPGAACSQDSDCGVPGSSLSYTCQTDLGSQDNPYPFPNGYCTTTSCTATGEGACPVGSYCMDYLNTCYKTCAKDADCAGGYRCLPVGELLGQGAGAGQYVCWPSTQCSKEDPSQCGAVGADCSSDGDCQDGDQCLPETYTDQNGATQFTGFVGGYCFRVERGGTGGDSCPPGSVEANVDPSDSHYDYCLKPCTVGEVDSGCGLGESCLQASQASTTAGVCWNAQCSADSDCQMAQCSTTGDKSACGKGQPCGTDGFCKTADACNQDSDCCLDQQCQFHGTCDTATHTCNQTTCDGSLGLCELDCTAADAYTDTDGSCAGVTCPAGQVCDKSKPVGSNCVNALCPEGTTCNATTKRCDRSCNGDENCGPNAVCESGTCVTHCTKWNEASLCTGDTVCNYDSGHCQPKCTDDASCGEGERCDSASGHCLVRCDVDASVCTADQLCDAATGGCIEKCTNSNEGVVCAQNTFCQASTGKCLPNCASDASVCGGESCSVVLGNGKCGRSCSNATSCGVDQNGNAMSCVDDGTGTKRCTSQT